MIGATGLASASVVACGSESSTSSSVQVDGAAERADAAGDGSDDNADGAAVETGAQDSAGDERPPTVRRPFLIGSSLRSARSEAREDWAAQRSRSVNGDDDGLDDGLDAATACELASVWLADELGEHASIAAFARFTMLMLSVGAPPELVVASQRASIDEVAHARECFALARRYGAAAVGPGALDVHDAIGAVGVACSRSSDLCGSSRHERARDPRSRGALPREARGWTVACGGMA